MVNRVSVPVSSRIADNLEGSAKMIFSLIKFEYFLQRKYDEAAARP
jgi:hypothetical protein